MIRLNIINESGEHIGVADIKKLSMLIQNKANYNTSVQNVWREYVPGGGIGYFQINCSGIATGKVGDNMLLRYAFDNLIFKYEFIFAESMVIVSHGKIGTYEKIFKYLDADEFSMTILSSGKVEML